MHHAVARAVHLVEAAVAGLLAQHRVEADTELPHDPVGVVRGVEVGQDSDRAFRRRLGRAGVRHHAVGQVEDHRALTQDVEVLEQAGLLREALRVVATVHDRRTVQRDRPVQAEPVRGVEKIQPGRRRAGLTRRRDLLLAGGQRAGLLVPLVVARDGEGRGRRLARRGQPHERGLAQRGEQLVRPRLEGDRVGLLHHGQKVGDLGVGHGRRPAGHDHHPPGRADRGGLGRGDETVRADHEDVGVGRAPAGEQDGLEGFTGVDRADPAVPVPGARREHEILDPVGLGEQQECLAGAPELAVPIGMHDELGHRATPGLGKCTEKFMEKCALAMRRQ